MNIGKRIAIVRQAKGLTIAEVSEKIGNKGYDRMETGKNPIKFEVLLKICEAIDIKIWELTAETLIIEIKD